MDVADTILDTVGNTPLVKINFIDTEATVLAKLEQFNPGGSIKDRVGIAMIANAELQGKLQPGDTIVEPTSGNTGIGLAQVCLLKGYNLVVTMPDKMSKEKAEILEAYGAEVVWCETDVEPDHPESYYSKAEKIAEERDGFIPDQYSNLDNPMQHFDTTGPELWRQTRGTITHFVAGMGTGGTITGVGTYLQRKNPDIQIIGVDPEGSIYNDVFNGQEPTHDPYETEGIGEDMLPETIDMTVLDDVVTVTDDQAFRYMRKLVKNEAILAGSSAGAAIYGAEQVAKNAEKGDVIVTIIPDTGRNYDPSIYRD